MRDSNLVGCSVIPSSQLGAAVTGIEGCNFSGRTALLEHFADDNQPNDESRSAPNALGPNAFLGVDAYNYLSGLVPTTRGELELHGIDESERSKSVRALLAMVHSDRFQLRNPLTLSGGEQVIVTLATSILAARDLVAVDCCFEQLSADTRHGVIKVLNEIGQAGVKTVLADNRLREFAHQISVRPIGEFAHPKSFCELPTIRGTSFACLKASHCILLEDVSFQYPRSRSIFQDLSYRFEPGQLYFLSGPNGAGKTTLCKLLCGLIRPNRGRIIDEHSVQLDPWKRPGRLAAYHFQNPDLQLFSTSVQEEIGHDGQDVANSMGLEKFMTSHPHDLPFVLRKRIALAATFARRCPWLILDEPALGQDDANATALATILKTLTDAHVGVIVVTHSHWFRQLLPAARTLYLDCGSLREKGSNRRG